MIFSLIYGAFYKTPNGSVVYDPFILKELYLIAFMHNPSLDLKVDIPPFLDAFPGSKNDPLIGFYRVRSTILVIKDFGLDYLSIFIYSLRETSMQGFDF